MSITAKLAEVLRLSEKATPGEWHLFRDDPSKTLAISNDSEHASADSAVVHWVGFDSSDKPYKERRANARAIVAAVNLVRDPELAGLVRDAERLDFLERAGDVFISIVVDAPHDGEYSFGHDLGPTTYAPTLRAAIDAALSGRDGQGVGK